jgi:hypothetical protein
VDVGGDVEGGLGGEVCVGGGDIEGCGFRRGREGKGVLWCDWGGRGGRI